MGVFQKNLGVPFLEGYRGYIGFRLGSPILDVPFLGPEMRIIVCWGLHRGPPMNGNYQISLNPKPLTLNPKEF